MRKKWLIALLVTNLSLPSLSEAAIGGGRGSYGSRGSRGMSAPRSYPRQAPGPRTQPFSYGRTYPGAGTGSSFSRGLMGGLAGGFLGSMLFRGLGGGGYSGGMYGPGGYGPNYGYGYGYSRPVLGFLDLLVLGALGFWLVRRLRRRRSHHEVGWRGGRSLFMAPSWGPGREQEHDSAANESYAVSNLRAGDPGFDPVAFKEGCAECFLRLQSAWSSGNLESIRSLVTPELYELFASDRTELRRQRRVNPVESVVVRGVELVESWLEYDRQYATARIKATAIDYVEDETTGRVIEGDRSRPKVMDESWTFVRTLDPSGRSTGWVLSAVQRDATQRLALSG